MSNLEVNFLVQFAINTLMAQGVVFALKEEASEEKLRLYTSEGETLQ